MAKAKDPKKWFGIFDSSPVADVISTDSYCKETSDDNGRTWEYPRPSTGQFLKLDMADALYADCSVEYVGGVATIQSPHPMGGLIRYTPTN